MYNTITDQFKTMRKIFILLTAFIALSAFQNADAKWRAKHVVFIGADGWGAYSVPKATGIPNEVIDLIAGQRKSGIVFVCVRDVPFEGSTREECAFAVRRAIPGRAGHTPIYQVYAGDWQPAGEAQLELAGSTIDELWASLCSQTILGTPEVENLDARIIRHTEIARLESEVDKLTRDHQRVKNPAQRNEIYAKLHKAKAQLAKLREA